MRVAFFVETHTYRAMNKRRHNVLSTARRSLWFGLGIIALILGAIGIVLPLLPTTPFVLLAAFAFGKSSTRLRNWLQSHKTFGPIITDWEQNGAIAKKYKRLACAMMAASLALSLALGVAPTIIMIQAVFLSLAAFYVLTRPSA